MDGGIVWFFEVCLFGWFLKLGKGYDVVYGKDGYEIYILFVLWLCLFGWVFWLCLVILRSENLVLCRMFVLWVVGLWEGLYESG